MTVKFLLEQTQMADERDQDVCKPGFQLLIPRLRTVDLTDHGLSLCLELLEHQRKRRRVSRDLNKPHHHLHRSHNNTSTTSIPLADLWDLEDLTE